MEKEKKEEKKEEEKEEEKVKWANSLSLVMEDHFQEIARPQTIDCFPSKSLGIHFTLYPQNLSYQIHPQKTQSHTQTPPSPYTQGDPKKAGQGARGGREAKARYIGLIWEKMTKQMVSRWWLLFTHNLTYICGQTSGLLRNGHEKTFMDVATKVYVCILYFAFAEE